LKSEIDVDAIIELHERFLIKITNAAMLKNKHFVPNLLKIFNIILEFCDNWRRGKMNFFYKNFQKSNIVKLIDVCPAKIFPPLIV